MGKIEQIRVSKEPKPPMVICGKCKREIKISIKPFMENVSDVIQDKCPACGTTLYVGVLILAHTELKGLLSCIKIVVNSLQNASIKLMG